MDLRGVIIIFVYQNIFYLSSTLVVYLWIEFQLETSSFRIIEGMAPFSSGLPGVYCYSNFSSQKGCSSSSPTPLSSQLSPPGHFQEFVFITGVLKWVFPLFIDSIWKCILLFPGKCPYSISWVIPSFLCALLAFLRWHSLQSSLLTLNFLSFVLFYGIFPQIWPAVLWLKFLIVRWLFSVFQYSSLFSDLFVIASHSYWKDWVSFLDSLMKFEAVFLFPASTFFQGLIFWFGFWLASQLPSVIRRDFSDPSSLSCIHLSLRHQKGGV